MTIKEFKDRIHNFTGAERARWVTPVMDKILSRKSKLALITFQNQWEPDSKVPFQEFLKLQNSLIVKLIDIEIATRIRHTEGLPALTDDTEIEPATYLKKSA